MSILDMDYGVFWFQPGIQRVALIPLAWFHPVSPVCCSQGDPWGGQGAGDTGWKSFEPQNWTVEGSKRRSGTMSILGMEYGVFWVEPGIQMVALIPLGMVPSRISCLWFAGGALGRTGSWRYGLEVI